MPSRITMHKITNTIATAQTAGTTFSKPIRGRILAIRTVYSNTTHANSSDRDVNLWEMNPEDPLVTGDALQEILDIGNVGADPDADNAVYYPETNAQDYQGTNLDLSDGQGGNVAKYVPFVVYGTVMLQVTAAAAADITTVYLIVEEY